MALLLKAKKLPVIFSNSRLLILKIPILLWAEVCVPLPAFYPVHYLKIPMLEVLTSNGFLQNLIVFGDMAFKQVIKILIK